MKEPGLLEIVEVATTKLRFEARATIRVLGIADHERASRRVPIPNPPAAEGFDLSLFHHSLHLLSKLGWRSNTRELSLINHVLSEGSQRGFVGG
jgi:hypothetical protein